MKILKEGAAKAYHNPWATPDQMENSVAQGSVSFVIRCLFAKLPAHKREKLLTKLRDKHHRLVAKETA